MLASGREVTTLRISLSLQFRGRVGGEELGTPPAPDRCGAPGVVAEHMDAGVVSANHLSSRVIRDAEALARGAQRLEQSRRGPAHLEGGASEPASSRWSDTIRS